MRSQPASYHGYRFPPDIISHAVWLYHRFCLSFRDAEDLLAQRGVTVTYEGCVATFKKRQEIDGSGRAGAVSCNHPEQLVDELNLSPTIRTAHPPRLPLPDHVHGLIALDRSPRRVECTKALLCRHASFDRSMILLHDVVQVLDRSVAATASQDSCLFRPRNCRAVETGLVSVDDAGLRMRRISQRLAEQACGRSGIAPPREHEVNRGAAGIDGSVEVAPTALDTNVGLGTATSSICRGVQDRARWHAPSRAHRQQPEPARALRRMPTPRLSRAAACPVAAGATIAGRPGPCGLGASRGAQTGGVRPVQPSYAVPSRTRRRGDAVRGAAGPAGWGRRRAGIACACCARYSTSWSPASSSSCS